MIQKFNLLATNTNDLLHNARGDKNTCDEHCDKRSLVAKNNKFHYKIN